MCLYLYVCILMWLCNPKRLWAKHICEWKRSNERIYVFWCYRRCFRCDKNKYKKFIFIWCSEDCGDIANDDVEKEKKKNEPSLLLFFFLECPIRMRAASTQSMFVGIFKSKRKRNDFHYKWWSLSFYDSTLILRKS